MKVNLAKSAGFCSGVKIAVRKALQAAKKYPGCVYMLGDIVHNEIVVEGLAEAGIKVVAKISEIPPRAVILIRAHGAVPKIYEAAKKRNLKIVDATCCMVADIHKEAIRITKQGLRVAIIGDKKHDEVEGIAGQIDKAIILPNKESVQSFPRGVQKIGVVVQSTQSEGDVKDVLGELFKRVREVYFVNTICNPTKQHQAEMETMPKENDVVIVVGSKTSANTKRLTKISRELNPKTYQVMTAEDLEKKWFRGAKSVGVTAGASTPDSVIKDVVGALNKY